MPEGGTPNIEIAPLGPQHDRANFACGEEYIDEWCKKSADKDHNKYKQRVFVATEPGSVAVIGLYSLTIRSIEPGAILNTGHGNGRHLPAIYFATLGVCLSHAKQGVGTALMVDSFKRALRVSEDVGTYCLWLTAVNEEKLKFYEARQFIRIAQGKLDMYVPLATLRDAFNPPSVAAS